MSWRLPTIPEVLDTVSCLLTGHSWNEKGVCKDCGAEK